MNKSILISIVSLLCTALFACHKGPAKTKEQVMQERLVERMDRWEMEMEKKCLREIDTRAVALTDSIVIANAKLNRDTSIQAIIPGRPTRPNYKPPADTVPIKPVLK